MSSSKSFVTLKEKYDRVVVLIDMDCFYCQVEEFLDEDRLKNKPIAVVQYLENAGIIAVNYAARALGVTRHMREKEAKAVCKELICVKVPSKNGKADLSKYRDAGLEVAKVLQTFTPLLERASVDEAYLDITDSVVKKMQELRENKFQLQPANFVNTYAVGYENIGAFVQDVTSSVDRNYDDVPDEDRTAFASSKLRLLIGASIVNEIRNAVKAQTKYECSAGIAHNKILAKLCCGMNKPNKQTILPIESITGLYRDLAVNKVKSLGGKLGEEVCTKLKVKTMADLLSFSENELQTHFQARIGSWLYWMARGIDLEKVTPKFMSKSIAVSKNFRGKNEITSVHTLKHWLKELSKEIVERLEKDAVDCSRTAKQMIVSFTQGRDGKDVSSSRTVALNGNSLNTYTAEQMAEEALDIIKRNTAKFLKAEGAVIMAHNIKHLGISAGKFEDNVAAGSSNNLQNLLKNHQKREIKKSPQAERSTEESPKRSEALAAIKRFEMKSPPLLAKTPNIQKIAKPQATIVKSHDVSQLNLLESFAGENAIRGVNTLKHWIAQLLRGFNDGLKDKSRSPTVLTLRYKKIVNENENESSEMFPLEGFFNNLIDVDVIVSSMQRSGDLMKGDGSNELQHCITFIEIIPSGFEEGRKWSYTIKTEESLIEDKVAEVEGNQEASDNKDFHELINKELSLLEEEEVSEDEDVEQSMVDLNPIQEAPESGSTCHESFEKAETCERVETAQSEETCIPEVSAAVDPPGPSYMETYAEFQPRLLPIDELNPKEPCPECGKMIARLDMVAHLDHHLAFEISRQQREEYKQQNKIGSQSSTSQKKTQTKKKQQSKPNNNLIEKYAVKVTKGDIEKVDNKTKCEQCEKFIINEEYVSHLDYHFAKKLRDEEIKNNLPQKVDTSRKRPGSSQHNLPKMKSVKSYFSVN